MEYNCPTAVEWRVLRKRVAPPRVMMGAGGPSISPLQPASLRPTRPRHLITPPTPAQPQPGRNGHHQTVSPPPLPTPPNGWSSHGIVLEYWSVMSNCVKMGINGRLIGKFPIIVFIWLWSLLQLGNMQFRYDTCFLGILEKMWAKLQYYSLISLSLRKYRTALASRNLTARVDILWVDPLPQLQTLTFLIPNQIQTNPCNLDHKGHLRL